MESIYEKQKELREKKGINFNIIYTPGSMHSPLINEGYVLEVIYNKGCRIEYGKLFDSYDSALEFGLKEEENGKYCSVNSNSSDNSNI